MWKEWEAWNQEVRILISGHADPYIQSSLSHISKDTIWRGKKYDIMKHPPDLPHNKWKRVQQLITHVLFCCQSAYLEWRGCLLGWLQTICVKIGSGWPHDTRLERGCESSRCPLRRTDVLLFGLREKPASIPTMTDYCNLHYKWK